MKRVQPVVGGIFLKRFFETVQFSVPKRRALSKRLVLIRVHLRVRGESGPCRETVPIISERNESFMLPQDAGHAGVTCRPPCLIGAMFETWQKFRRNFFRSE
jgi:hypothetical protein